jgi:predicted DNA-binding ribbon-helix-helix protein
VTTSALTSRGPELRSRQIGFRLGDRFVLLNENAASMLVSRNVTVSGRRTSIRLEPEMWDGLTDICRREDITQHQLATLVDRCRNRSSLTAKLRVFILAYFRSASTEAGHTQAGHGRGVAAASRRAGRRPRKMTPPMSDDNLYEAVCAQMERLDSRRPERKGDAA